MASNRKRLIRRGASSISCHADPLLNRIFAGRGVVAEAELNHSIGGLLSPNSLKGIASAASLLCTALTQNQSILIVGDFDADGATSCALMIEGLRSMGATNTNYLVPDRFRFGYGLTPEIVKVAQQFSPDLIVTVDNGISSIEGVDFANSLGINVLITDHHLPGATLPAAAAIVNPNQPGCDFPSKNLAGVGVAFYLLSVVRSQLREARWFVDRPEPKLSGLLDLVAIGTVADVVPLDQNNRRMVNEGLRRMRRAQCRPGVLALAEVAGCDRLNMTSRDIAFALAPRLNAAGRLEDMSIGIECLLAKDERAYELARALDQLNTERKEIESGMREEAEEFVRRLSIEDTARAGLCLYHEDWHQGIVGIVASRIKEKSHRPVICFAKSDNGELKGSARSVAGFHVRDALDAIATKHPGLLLKFGGHAMAAGMSLKEEDLERFSNAFDAEVSLSLGNAEIEHVVLSDGETGVAVTLELALMIENAAPWGQSFPEPVFDDVFQIIEQRLLGGKHLKMLLQPPTGDPIEAICFNQKSLLDSRLHCAYRIEVNRYRGHEKPQLVVEVVLN